MPNDETKQQRDVLATDGAGVSDYDVVDLLEVVKPGKKVSPPKAAGESVNFSADLDSMLDTIAKEEQALGQPAPQTDQPFPDPTPVDHQVNPHEELDMPSMDDLDNLLESLGADKAAPDSKKPAPPKAAASSSPTPEEALDAVPITQSQGTESKKEPLPEPPPSQSPELKETLDTLEEFDIADLDAMLEETVDQQFLETPEARPVPQEVDADLLKERDETRDKALASSKASATQTPPPAADMDDDLLKGLGVTPDPGAPPPPASAQDATAQQAPVDMEDLPMEAAPAPQEAVPVDEEPSLMEPLTQEVVTQPETLAGDAASPPASEPSEDAQDTLEAAQADDGAQQLRQEELLEPQSDQKTDIVQPAPESKNSPSVSQPPLAVRPDDLAELDKALDEASEPGEGEESSASSYGEVDLNELDALLDDMLASAPASGRAGPAFSAASQAQGTAPAPAQSAASSTAALFPAVDEEALKQEMNSLRSTLAIMEEEMRTLRRDLESSGAPVPEDTETPEGSPSMQQASMDEGVLEEIRLTIERLDEETQSSIAPLLEAVHRHQVAMQEFAAALEERDALIASQRAELDAQAETVRQLQERIDDTFANLDKLVADAAAKVIREELAAVLQDFQ